MRRWQRGGRGGSSGSAATVASLTVEAAAWQKCNFGGSGSVLESAAAGHQQQRQCRVGGSSVEYADNDYNSDDGDD